MKHLTTIVMAAAVLFLASCGNSNKPTGQAAAPSAAPAKKVVSLPPYKAMVVKHSVKDYNNWYSSFTASDSLKKSFGLTSWAVGQGLDDDKMIVVYCTASDIQKAKDFGTSPDLKKAMEKSGVTSAPTISYLDVMFDDTSAIPQQERLSITHHVKDFDTWKKAFDAEGDSARATNGLVERLMARGVDDPNTVTIFFAVTDMAKAKARTASPDLKKIMEDAGVDGPPTITWFKWVAQSM